MEVSAINIPTGYKFQPTDEELIQYLVCKAMEQPLPWDGIVKDCNIYAKEPSELFEGSEEKVLYFFTKLKKKNENGSRIDRVTGMGTWKGQDKAKPIKDGGNEEEGGIMIGAKRSFSYRLKSDSKTAKGWTMTEYNLEGTYLEQAKVKDYVICQIKRQKQEGKLTREAMVRTEYMEPEGEVFTECIEPEKVTMQHKGKEIRKAILVITECIGPEGEVFTEWNWKKM